MGKTSGSLWSLFWHEVEPIAVHAFVVLTLEGSLLLIGLATKLLEILLPGQKERLALVETIDVWLALALLCMFGAYTLVQIGIRLTRALSSEWSRKEVNAPQAPEMPSNE